MRLPESTIRQAILSPVEEIRRIALSYFSRTQPPDESLMPLVIQSVEQYGRDRSVHVVRTAERLPQTAATIGWITAELDKDWLLGEVPIDNYCFALAMILVRTRTDLLRPEMAELRCFPQELKGRFHDRLEMAAWDWQTGWAALKEWGERVTEQDSHTREDSRRAESIIESLARHRDHGETVLSFLEGVSEDASDDMLYYWLSPAVAELAGLMRLDAAVPTLVRMLGDDNHMPLTDSALTALTWIGGDVVALAIAESWPEAESGWRLSAAEVLEDIHTDASVETLLTNFSETAAGETPWDFIAHGLLSNFVLEAVEPIRRGLLAADEDTLDIDDIQQHLVAACTIMGATFPEYQAWYDAAVAEEWGWKGVSDQRMRELYAGDDDDDFSDDDWDSGDDDDWDDDEQNGLGEDLLQSQLRALRRNQTLEQATGGLPKPETFADAAGDELDSDEDFDERGLPKPIHNDQTQVGRNDPCPCGSGRKYKKCCLKKDPPATGS